MSDSVTASTSAGGDSDSYRRLLLALAVLGLLVAAFALPSVGAGGPGPGGGIGGSGGGEAPNSDGRSGGEGTGDGHGGSPFDIIEFLIGDGGGSENGNEDDGVSIIRDEPEDGISVYGEDGDVVVTTEEDDDRYGRDEYEGCLVYVGGEPRPGGELPVFVWNDGAQASDRPVWFNGEFQGRTDENGKVIGEVGYDEELTIRVSVPSADSCEFYSEDGSISGENAGSLGAGSALPVSTAGPSRLSAPTAAISGQARLPAAPPADGGNHSTNVGVDGTVTVDVIGEPYPDESVEVVTRIDGRALADATVEIDDETVGKTDRSGRVNVTLPDDGRETVTVTATRGEFSNSTTVELLVLDISVVPDRPLPVPGQAATATVTMGGEPVRNTTVTLDGKILGRTDENGTLAVTLPGEAGTAYATAVREQTDSTPVWQVYAPTVLVTLLIVLGATMSLVYTARRDGAPTFRAGVLAWLAVGAIYAAYVLGGGSAALWTLVAVAVVGGVVGSVTHAEETRENATGLWEWLQLLAERVRRIAVTVADWATTAAATLLAFVESLLGRLRSISVSLTGLRRTVAGIATWVAGVVTGLVATLYPQNREQVTLVVVVLAAASVAFYVAGPWGAAIVLAVVLLVAVLRQRSTGSEPSVADGRSAAPGPNAGTAVESEASPVTLRRLWRTFARWVVPGRWRSATPGEVARAAVDRGFPEEPVERLTGVFRDVEYGDRSLSTERWQTARDAFEALSGESETETEESG